MHAAECLHSITLYDSCVPKLWSQTIDTHRHEVREAIMDIAWALAVRHGPMSVSMSQVAQETGIGRATLYKYFPDVESILHAKHESHVLAHLAHLSELRERHAEPGQRLEAVAQGYAEIVHHRAQHGGLELSALTHRPERVAGADQELSALFRDLLKDAAGAGLVRTDMDPKELAAFIVHALGAAGTLPSKKAIHRLVNVTLSALKPVVP